MITIYTNEGIKEFATAAEAHTFAGTNYMLKDTSTGQIVTTVEAGKEYVAVVKAKAA